MLIKRHNLFNISSYLLSINYVIFSIYVVAYNIQGWNGYKKIRLCRVSKDFDLLTNIPTLPCGDTVHKVKSTRLYASAGPALGDVVTAEVANVGGSADAPVAIVKVSLIDFFDIDAIPYFRVVSNKAFYCSLVVMSFTLVHCR